MRSLKWTEYKLQLDYVEQSPLPLQAIVIHSCCMAYYRLKCNPVNQCHSNVDFCAVVFVCFSERIHHLFSLFRPIIQLSPSVKLTVGLHNFVTNWLMTVENRAFKTMTSVFLWAGLSPLTPSCKRGR